MTMGPRLSNLTESPPIFNSVVDEAASSIASCPEVDSLMSLVAVVFFELFADEDMLRRMVVLVDGLARDITRSLRINGEATKLQVCESKAASRGSGVTVCKRLDWAANPCCDRTTSSPKHFTTYFCLPPQLECLRTDFPDGCMT